jgi:hypothetical protein
MRFRGLAAVCFAFSALHLSACNGTGTTSGCVTGISNTCDPLYPPTFDQIYARTLAPTCAQPGTLCHGSAGVQGGLFFTTADSAYALLLGEVGGRPRVIRGNPSCSLLVERLAASDPSQLMPPGAELSPAEQCSITQWISNGAMR